MRQLRVHAALLSLAMALACGGGGDTTPAPGTAATVGAESPTPAADATDSASAEARIQSLYAPYLNGGLGGRGIETPGLASPELSALLDADRRAADASGGARRLDYDVVVDGQDFQVSGLSLRTIASGTHASVIASFRNFSEPREITYDMVRRDGTWQVDDVRFSDGRSLRKLLAP